LDRETPQPHDRGDRTGPNPGTRGVVLDAAKRDGVDRSLLFLGTRDALSIARFYQRHGYNGWGIQKVR
jgi:lysozyme family protein